MKRRLWPWFVGGFVVTFVLLAVRTVYVMLPSGEAVVGIPLWRYYVNEWPRAFQPRVVGPANSSQDVLLSWTLQHVFLSALGGAVLLAIAWWLQRRKIAASSAE